MALRGSSKEIDLTLTGSSTMVERGMVLCRHVSVGIYLRRSENVHDGGVEIYNLKSDHGSGGDLTN